MEVAWRYLEYWRMVAYLVWTLSVFVDNLLHPCHMRNLEDLAFILGDTFFVSRQGDISFLTSCIFFKWIHLYTHLIIAFFIFHIIDICPIFPQEKQDREVDVDVGQRTHSWLWSSPFLIEPYRVPWWIHQHLWASPPFLWKVMNYFIFPILHCKFLQTCADYPSWMRLLESP